MTLHSADKFLIVKGVEELSQVSSERDYILFHRYFMVNESLIKIIEESYQN